MSDQPATPPAFDTMSPDEEALLPSEPVTAPPVHVVSAPPGGKVIDLPSGFKVALRGTRSVRNRDRATLFDGLDFEGGSKIAAGFGMLANINRLLITDWDVRDFDDATGEPIGDVLPIPNHTDADVLGLLSMEDGAALDAEAQAVQKMLMPNFEPDPNPASPTRPSGV